MSNPTIIFGEEAMSEFAASSHVMADCKAVEPSSVRRRGLEVSEEFALVRDIS